MKTSDIFTESNDDKVINLQDIKQEKAKTGKRQYGTNGYVPLIQSLIAKSRKLKQMTFATAQTNPLFVPKEKYTTQGCKKILQQFKPKIINLLGEQLGGLTNEELEMVVKYNHTVSAYEFNLVCSTWMISSALREQTDIAPDSNTLNGIIYPVLGKIASEVFGNIASSIKLVFTGMLNYPVILIRVPGVATTKMPISTIMKSILNEFNIGGLRFFWVNKLKTGYGVKIEGVELLSASDFNELCKKLSITFENMFIKGKQDGEIQSIGHRPVGPGLTNYRFYFTPELKQNFSLQ